MRSLTSPQLLAPTTDCLTNASISAAGRAPEVLATSRPAREAGNALRRWRADAARAARVEAQSLLSDRVLDAIAAARPSDHESLAAVEGVDPLLAARLGDGVLAALREAGSDASTV